MGNRRSYEYDIGFRVGSGGSAVGPIIFPNEYWAGVRAGEAEKKREDDRRANSAEYWSKVAFTKKDADSKDSDKQETEQSP